MGAFKFLLLTFLFRVSELLADNNESIAKMVEGIWPQVQLFLNVSDVYERIEQLPDNVESIVDLFAPFGELFVDGTLGRCRDHYDDPCAIIVEGNDHYALKQKVAHVLEALAGLQDENAFAEVLPYSEDDYYYRKIRSNAKWIFYKTKQCYYYFKKYVISALLSGRGTELTMHFECKGWVAEDPPRWFYSHPPKYGFRYVINDDTINHALREIGPNCSFHDLDRDFYDSYTKKRGFPGGESNRCLQNFVVRFNHYNEEAFKTFLAEMHKYLLQDLTLYGILLPFSQANETERNRRKEWVRESIAVLSEDLLTARELFKEAPTTTVTTTDMPAQTTLTVDIVEASVTNVMHESDIEQLLWKERPRRYGGLITKIIDEIKSKHSNFSSERSIEGIMFLPYGVNDNHLYCVLNRPANDNETSFYQKQNYKGASYFIACTGRLMPSDVLGSRISVIRSHEAAIWDAVFGEDAKDICTKLQTAVRDPQLIGLDEDRKHGEFTAVVAIRCAYEFVWYELGWRYYKAAATTSEYVLSRHADEYNKACAQLIFLQ